MYSEGLTFQPVVPVQHNVIDIATKISEDGSEHNEAGQKIDSNNNDADETSQVKNYPEEVARMIKESKQEFFDEDDEDDENENEKKKSHHRQHSRNNIEKRDGSRGDKNDRDDTLESTASSISTRVNEDCITSFGKRLLHALSPRSNRRNNSFPFTP